MRNFKDFRTQVQSELNEAVVNVELKPSAHERELFWLQKWIGVRSTLNQDLGRGRYALTFRNDGDAQKYAKELKDLGIAKSVKYNA